MSEEAEDRSHQASVFWDKDGILLVGHLEKGAAITATYTLHF
jgi:hypothetical protein